MSAVLASPETARRVDFGGTGGSAGSNFANHTDLQADVGFQSSLPAAELYYALLCMLYHVPCQPVADLLKATLEEHHLLGSKILWNNRRVPIRVADMQREHPEVDANFLPRLLTNLIHTMELQDPTRIRNLQSIFGHGPDSIFHDVDHGRRLRAQRLYLQRNPLLAQSVGRREYVRTVARNAFGVLSTLSTMVRQFRVVGHLLPAYSCIFDSVGRRMYSAADDGLIKVWSVQSGRLLATLRGHANVINDLSVNDDNTLLASSSDDSTVRIWNLVTGAPVVVLRCCELRKKKVVSVQFCPAPPDADGFQYIGVITEEGRVLFWKYHSESLMIENLNDGLGPAPSNPRECMCARFSPGGAIFVVGFTDSFVRLYETGGRHLTTLTGHDQKIKQVAVSQSGDRIMSCSEDGKLVLWTRAVAGGLYQSTWDPVTLLEPLTGAVKLSVLTLEFSAVDKWCIAVAERVDGEISTYRINIWSIHGELVRVIDKLSTSTFVAEAHPFEPDVMLTGSYDGKLLLWNVAKGTILNDLKADVGSLTDSHWSPDGQSICACSTDGSIHYFAFGDAQAFSKLPTEQFFATDYGALIRHADGTVTDDSFQMEPHLIPPQPLTDRENGAYPDELQIAAEAREAVGVSLTPSEKQERFEVRLAQHQLECSGLLSAGEAVEPVRAPVPIAPAATSRIGRPRTGATPRVPRPPRAAAPADDDAYEDDEDDDEEEEEDAAEDSAYTGSLSESSSSEDSLGSGEEEDEDEQDSYDRPSGRRVTRQALRRERRNQRHDARRRARESNELGSSAPARRTRSRYVEMDEDSEPEEEDVLGSDSEPEVKPKKRMPAAVVGMSSAASKVSRPPPTWILQDRPHMTPYYPQMNDEVLFFQDVHRKFTRECQKSHKMSANQLRPRPSNQLRMSDLAPIVRCRISQITFEIVSSLVMVDLCCQILSYNDDPPLPEQRSSVGPSPLGYFNVRIYDRPGVADIFVLANRYEDACAYQWTPSLPVKSLFDDQWYTGRVLEAVFTHPTPTSRCLTVTVQWADSSAKIDELSPWELVPLPDLDLGNNPVEPENMAHVNIVPLWLANDPKFDPFECARLAIALSQLIQTCPEIEPFVEPVDLVANPTYTEVVAHPMHLNLIISRLGNGFYRHRDSLLQDVFLVVENARTFNAAGSLLISWAWGIYTCIVDFLSDPSATELNMDMDKAAEAMAADAQNRASNSVGSAGLAVPSVASTTATEPTPILNPFTADNAFASMSMLNFENNTFSSFPSSLTVLPAFGETTSQFDSFLPQFSFPSGSLSASAPVLASHRSRSHKKKIEKPTVDELWQEQANIDENEDEEVLDADELDFDPEEEEPDDDDKPFRTRASTRPSRRSGGGGGGRSRPNTRSRRPAGGSSRSKKSGGSRNRSRKRHKDSDESDEQEWTESTKDKFIVDSDEDEDEEPFIDDDDLDSGDGYSRAPARRTRSAPSVADHASPSTSKAKRARHEVNPLEDVLQKIKALDTDRYFWQPVDPERDGAPNYYSIITNPMDFQSIQEKIERNKYANNIGEFIDDLHLIFDNAMIYNSDDTRVHNQAAKIKRRCTGITDKLLV